MSRDCIIVFLFGLITKTRDITLDNTQPETEISYIYSKVKDQLGLFRIFGNKSSNSTKIYISKNCTILQNW